MYIVKSSNDEIATFDVKAKKAVLLGDGNGPVAFTTMDEYVPSPVYLYCSSNTTLSVGRLVVAALQHPEAADDRILIVNSFTATPHEIVAEFEKQMGEKWSVSYTSLERLKEIEKEAWASGAPYATPTTLRRIWTEGGTLYDKPRDNALIGDPKMETLADQVKKIIEGKAYF
jgi:hypothetical protein